MEEKPNVWETLRDILIAIAVTILVILAIVGILYSFEEGDFILLSAIIGVLIITAICIVVSKFYNLLNKIYKRLDSLDLPIKHQDGAEKESVKGKELSELDVWKQKALKNIEDAVADGRIDSEKSIELSKRIQEAKQIPVKKNKENAGA